MALNFNQPLAQVLAGMTKIAAPRSAMGDAMGNDVYVDPATGQRYTLSSDNASTTDGQGGHQYLNPEGAYGQQAYQWDQAGNALGGYTSQNPNAGNGGLNDLVSGFVLPAAGMAIGAGALGGFGGAGVAGPGMPGWGMDLGVSGIEGLGAGGAATGVGGLTAGGTALGGVGGAAGAAGGAGATAAAGAGGAGGLAGLTAGGSGLYGPLLTAGASLLGGALQAGAARDASGAQVGAANAGIAEQQRQFDAIQKLLAPYVQAGTAGLTGYQNLSGVNGTGAQQTAIDGLTGSAEFGSLTKQGEDAILQNASATGGLRGGNTQDALAKQRSSLLSALIDRQLGRYSGLTTIGQNSATGVGNAGLQTGSSVAGLLQQGGAAQAGGIISGTNAITNALSGVSGLIAGGGGINTGIQTPTVAPGYTAAAPVTGLTTGDFTRMDRAF